MSSPFISVLVTAYNREKYIAECLKSILQSSYSNYEVIVLDDASKDNTVKIAKEFELKDSRVRVLVNEKNLGQFGNRNKAASFARYDYIKFIDSDDIMYSHCLEVFATAAAKYPEAGVFAEWHFENWGIVFPTILSPGQSYINHFLRGNNLLFIGPSGTMYNKELFFKVKGFSESEGILADTLLSLQLAAISSSVGVSRDTFFWRVHNERVTEGQKDYIRMLQERYRISMLALNSADCPVSGKMAEKCKLTVKKIFARNLVNVAVKKGNFKGLRKLMTTCNFRYHDLLNALRLNN